MAKKKRKVVKKGMDAAWNHPMTFVVGLVIFIIVLFALYIVNASASTCAPTGFFRDSINMTAAKINPTRVVTDEVNAAGCNIGVYYDNGTGSVNGANIHGANYFGVVVNGDINDVSVDIQNSSIHSIGETPLNGAQHGVAVYYREFGTGRALGKIWHNDIYQYQKGGIVANGTGINVDIKNNTVNGQGPVNYIAQNGIQVGYGATAQVMNNTVTGNSYTGSSAVSGGILVVGGAGYGTCIGNNPCDYTTGTQIEGNTITNNDVGIFLTNLAADFSAPLSATNIKAVNNTVSSNGVHNGYVYQAGVSDVGNNDKIINNKISGTGYDPATLPGSTFSVDADLSFTNKAKVHANKFD